MARSIRNLFRSKRHGALPLTLVAALSLAACGGGDAPEGEAPAQAEAPAADGDMIIVSGAAGELGEVVVEQLLDAGVAASRLILVSPSPNDLGRYASQGASTRMGDPTQPESLPAAYEGGDRMLLISADADANQAELNGNAIDAAVAAGVQHIAYTSLVDLDNNASPLAAGHAQTEAALRESGVAWTMLRNSLFMDPLVEEAIDMLFDGLVESSEQGAAYVTRYDVARAAAAVLTTDGHESMVYDITGPAVVYRQDVAVAVSEVTELPVRVVDPDAPSVDETLSVSSFQVVSDHVEQLTGQAPMTIHDLLEANHDYIMAGTGA